ncbi:MAG: Cytochrome bd-I ubiquinol oxidase subunit 2 [Bacteroidetes bacterium ADurb.Bin408]|nr:MAG: Cytochrome bd-I ubiquinol oxidase subunit 2 [Bacteroidetes bacterium ADurb.Bin408]
MQNYWWIIVSILGSSLVFLLFVQGGQTFLNIIAKNEDEKTLLVNSIGRKWEFTFTTLVTFGGAMFAAFPLFYATSFGGAYYAWMAILFCFVIQAVSFEYRRKKGNFLGKGTYEFFLLLNGSLGVFLLGVAVASFFTGSEFSVNMYNHSSWQNPLFGLELLFNIRNIALGLAVFFLARVLGAQYLINNIDDELIRQRSRKQVYLNCSLFLVPFLYFIVTLMLSDGYAYDGSGNVFIEKYKYLHNLLQMPLVLVLFLAGVLLVLWGVYISAFKSNNKGIWFSGTGTFLTVFSLFMLAGFNNTAYYPSLYDMQSSLTIRNSSSSSYTLSAMSYVSLFVPVVIGYIIIAWRAIDRKKITHEEIKKDTHTY